MLNENETRRAWQKMIRAEVRSLYFAEMASRYTRRKQILAASSLFLTSGAAVSVGAKWPDWLPLLMSIAAAAIAAYMIAFNLDKLVSNLVRLHCIWGQLHADYEHLWSHWYEDDAERIFDGLLKRGREASELGTEVPYAEKLIDKWQDRVYDQYAATTS